MTENILLASQGIYDKTRKLFGTELLFRNEKGNTAMEVGENVATSEVLVNHFSGITKEISHLNRPAFINVCADFFLSDAFLPIDPSSVYIELVERITVNEKFVQAVKRWKQKGFRFALDDFEFTSDWAPLLDLADVVKIDVLDQDPELVCQRKAALSDYSCKWLAERVETPDEFNFFKDNGFHLFQGYFLSRPKIIKGTHIRPEQNSAAEILRVTTSNANFDEVAHAVERHPLLSIQILKMINSPLYNLSRSIESIREAVVFLGMEQLRKWAIVLSLVSASSNCLEAHRIVLKRAKFCELCANQLNEPHSDRAFMVGILSGLDILLGVTPKDFLPYLNLSNDISTAILEKQGRLGKILQLALNYERLITTHPERLNQSKVSQLTLYHEAFHWTEEVLNCIPNIR